MISLGTCTLADDKRWDLHPGSRLWGPILSITFATGTALPTQSSPCLHAHVASGSTTEQQTPEGRAAAYRVLTTPAPVSLPQQSRKVSRRHPQPYRPASWVCLSFPQPSQACPPTPGLLPLGHQGGSYLISTDHLNMLPVICGRAVRVDEKTPSQDLAFPQTAVVLSLSCSEQLRS